MMPHPAARRPTLALRWNDRRPRFGIDVSRFVCPDHRRGLSSARGGDTSATPRPHLRFATWCSARRGDRVAGTCRSLYRPCSTWSAAVPESTSYQRRSSCRQFLTPSVIPRMFGLSARPPSSAYSSPLPLSGPLGATTTAWCSTRRLTAAATRVRPRGPPPLTSDTSSASARRRFTDRCATSWPSRSRRLTDADHPRLLLA